MTSLSGTTGHGCAAHQDQQDRRDRVATRRRRRRGAAASLVAALALGLLGGAPAGAADVAAPTTPTSTVEPTATADPTADPTAAPEPTAPAGPWAGLERGPGTPARRADGQTWRVLVAGDSLSRGYNGDVTWRQRLWSELRRQGQPVTMVGPRTGSTARTGAPVWWANPLYGRVDRHDALGGTTISRERSAIAATVTSARPDVVCVLLGLNDLRGGSTAAAVVERMRLYLGELLRARPGTSVVLGALMDTVVYPSGAPRVFDTAGVNAGYARLVDELRAGGYDAHWAAPSAAAWTPRRDTFDGTHLTGHGEQVVLSRFGAALVGAKVLRRTPPPPATTVPWVTGAVATPSVRRRVATVSWGTWVGRVTANQVRVRITARTGTVRTLTSANREVSSLKVRLPRGYYRVQVAPIRGWMTGAYGPARTFRVR